MSNQAYDRTSLEALEAVAVESPGVVRLHPGPWGGAGTYLPGGLFPGLRIDNTHLRVHIVADALQPLARTTDTLRDRLARRSGLIVDIVVEDVAIPGEDDANGS